MVRDSHAWANATELAHQLQLTQREPDAVDALVTGRKVVDRDRRAWYEVRVRRTDASGAAAYFTWVAGRADGGLDARTATELGVVA